MNATYMKLNQMGLPRFTTRTVPDSSYVEFVESVPSGYVVHRKDENTPLRVRKIYFAHSTQTRRTDNKGEQKNLWYLDISKKQVILFFILSQLYRKYRTELIGEWLEENRRDDWDLEIYVEYYSHSP